MFDMTHNLVILNMKIEEPTPLIYLDLDDPNEYE